MINLDKQSSRSRETIACANVASTPPHTIETQLNDMPELVVERHVAPPNVASLEAG
jgi:hypothetical protein